MEGTSVTGKNVKLYREQAVLSIRELAEKAGVTPSTVWAVENGKQSPHPRTLRKLATALNIDPAELLKPRLL